MKLLTPKQWNLLTMVTAVVGMAITIVVAKTWTEGLCYYLATSTVVGIMFMLGLHVQQEHRFKSYYKQFVNDVKEELLKK